MSKPIKTKEDNNIMINNKTEENEVITVGPSSTRNANSKNSFTSSSKSKVDSTKKVYSTAFSKNFTSSKQANTNIKTIKVVDSGIPVAKHPSSTVNRSSSISVKSNNTRATSVSRNSKLNLNY